MTRRRRKFTARYGKASASYEWLGTRDGGAEANLDVSTAFELMAPAGASAVLLPDFTVVRIVGLLGLRFQSGVTTSTRVGAMVQKVNVGGDQTSDDSIDPLSTDVDDFDHSGIMWWQTWTCPVASVAAAEADSAAAFLVPIDIKIKRIINKRDRLILRVDASTTARMRASCNVRVLARMRG